MYDVSCKLISATISTDEISTDEIGNEIDGTKERLIPIIKVEDVRQNEFYNANQQGLKPSLRLRISSLNYNDEEELIYMSKKYSIIRTQEITYDEIVLVCERKTGNV